MAKEFGLFGSERIAFSAKGVFRFGTGCVATAIATVTVAAFVASPWEEIFSTAGLVAVVLATGCLKPAVFREAGLGWLYE